MHSLAFVNFLLLKNEQTSHLLSSSVKLSVYNINLSFRLGPGLLFMSVFLNTRVVEIEEKDVETLRDAY